MKKILVLSLVLALALSLLLPTAALAAKTPPVPPAPSSSFSAQGELSFIDTGTVKEIGKSGKWLVKDRHIQGEFVTGDLGPSAYTITYGGVFDLATQAGNLAGSMEVGSRQIGIVGKVEPLTMVYFAPYNMNLPKLTISGHWAGLRGLGAEGSYEAWMVFVPTADGHVRYIVASSFAMTGKYAESHR